MKDLRSQLANKCIHFNGVFLNKTCEIGISYESVRIKPTNGGYLFPCIKTGGHCDKCQFLTDEQIDQRIKEIEELSEKTFIVYASIKMNLATEGFVDCTCGGKVKFVKASSNGHIWCKCNKCDLGFNE